MNFAVCDLCLQAHLTQSFNKYLSIAYYMVVTVLPSKKLSLKKSALDLDGILEEN